MRRIQPKKLNPTNARGNNKNILRLIDLRYKTYVPECDNLDNFTKALISTLGVASRQASYAADSQETLLAEMDQRRESISGVSLDEEMANMVRFSMLITHLQGFSQP